jgi:hypothetical protein
MTDCQVQEEVVEKLALEAQICICAVFTQITEQWIDLRRKRHRNLRNQSSTEIAKLNSTLRLSPACFFTEKRSSRCLHA